MKAAIMHVVDLICPIALVAWGVWMIYPPGAPIAAGILWTFDNWRSSHAVEPILTEQPPAPTDKPMGTP